MESATDLPKMVTVTGAILTSKGLSRSLHKYPHQQFHAPVKSTASVGCLQDVVAELLKVSPGYKPPPDFRPAKKQRKIFVPTQQYPGYNFIGLIIGPRGNTQKRMQQESGAKIALRGKGSVKDGRGNRTAALDPADKEELHVIISADTDESLEKVMLLSLELIKALWATYLLPALDQAVHVLQGYMMVSSTWISLKAVAFTSCLPLCINLC